METSTPPSHIIVAKSTHVKRKREFINFDNLSNRELDALSLFWEKEATTFDIRFDHYLNGPHTRDDKTDNLFDIANRLWRRVRTLERWRVKNGRQQQKRTT